MGFDGDVTTGVALFGEAARGGAVDLGARAVEAGGVGGVAKEVELAVNGAMGAGFVGAVLGWAGGFDAGASCADAALG